MTARGCACRSSWGVRKVRIPALVCTILHCDSSLRQSNMLLGRQTDHRRSTALMTRRAPPQPMSVNTGHRARIPVYFGTDVRASSGIGVRVPVIVCAIQDSACRASTRGSANARTRPQAERGRSPACRPVTAREEASPCRSLGRQPLVRAYRALKATQRVRETRSKKGRGKTWELLGAIPLGAGPLAPNSSQVSPHVREG